MATSTIPSIFYEILYIMEAPTIKETTTTERIIQNKKRKGFTMKKLENVLLQ